MVFTDQELIDVPAGLRNVVVADTALGDVRGTEGFFHYRQYPAIELAKAQSFEAVWFLFLYGHLPDPAELEAFRARTHDMRTSPTELTPLLATSAIGETTGSTLLGWRTVLSALAQVRRSVPLVDANLQQRTDDALWVCTVTPTILAALHRQRNGLPAVAPRPDLSAAANWLYMVTGEVPDTQRARAIEQYLIATVDHGFNSSTFTARVVASTGADVTSAIIAAIGAFSGPLHGGAPDRALESLDEIGAVDRTRAWVRDKLSRDERIMGFGHAVYRTADPRADMLRDIAIGLGGDLVEFAVAVEEQVLATLAELKPGRNLYTNVEYYAGVVMERCGIPRSMFTPTFAVSRVIGWCANVLEQAENRKIIRPAARYVGPPPPHPIPSAGP